jgi:hypothetical protein
MVHDSQISDAPEHGVQTKICGALPWAVSGCPVDLGARWPSGPWTGSGSGSGSDAVGGGRASKRGAECASIAAPPVRRTDISAGAERG